MSMSNNNTENLDLSTLLNLAMKDLLKDKVELILKEEIKNALKNEPIGEENSRNGYYPRDLDTMYGKIENLAIPRDRKGDFQTTLFEPYKRRMVAVDELIVQLYQNGVSVRQVGKIMKNLLGEEYSQGTVSNVTNAVMEDVLAWQARPLKKRYTAIYLDALFVKVRRDTVAKEAIYIVLGICPEGHREILGFYVGGKESSNNWKEILQDIHNRGVKEVLLGVFDGLIGLEDAFLSIFPDADIQRCVIHKMRSTMNKVRKKDQSALSFALKNVYQCDNYEEASEAFDTVKKEWGTTYRKELNSWEEDLPVLLTFLRYPKAIQKYLYTTNLIERTNKEVRKRLKTMNSLPNIEAAEKIVYLTVLNYNEQWSTKKLSGFELAQIKLQEMFEKRFGNKIE